MGNPFEDWKPGTEHGDFDDFSVVDRDGVYRASFESEQDAERFLAMAKVFSQMKQALEDASVTFGTIEALSDDPISEDAYNTSLIVDAALAAAEAIGDPPTP